MSKIKKIIVASGTYGTEPSGQATFAQNFMREYGAKHPDVEIIQVVYGSAESGDRLFYVRRGVWRFVRYFVILMKLQNKETLFFAQDLISSGLPAAFASWLSGRRLVIRLGGDFLWEKMLQAKKTTVPLEEYYQQEKSIQERIFLFIYRLVLARARQVVFNTAWQRDLYCQIFALNKQKTSVIENVIDLVATPLDVPSVPTQTRTFVFIGRLIVMKNLRRLISAFGLLTQPDARLAIYGHGPELKILKVLSADDSRISVHGPVQGAEKERIINQADVITNVSLTDIHPHFVLEAIAHGKPVILTKNSYLPESIRNVCHLVDPLDLGQITRAMEHYMSETALQTAREAILVVQIPADWPAAIRAYEGIFSL